MKSQKGSAHVVIIIVLLVALISALGLVFWQNIQKKDPVENKHQASKMKNDDKTVPDEPSATDWKTYKSPLSGYTVKYPSNWSQYDDDPTKVFTNANGGKSSSLSLYSVKRTGSYDGHDANTYMCVNFAEYSTTGWSGYDRKKDNFVTIDTFKPNASIILNIVKDRLELEGVNSEMASTSLLVTNQANDDDIKLSDDYTLNASAQFNCAQGDYNALADSKEKFIDREEVEIAQSILKSIRF